MPRSRHVLYIEGVSSRTRTRDVEYEVERYGDIRDLKIDRDRAVVEFKYSDDAAFARRKLGMVIYQFICVICPSIWWPCVACISHPVFCCCSCC